MKSKVKYAALILVIGLLGLTILASPVFGGGKTTYLYDITITIDGEEFPTFTAAGNRNGTKIAGDGVFQQGMVKVVGMSFTDEVVDQLNEAEDEDSRFNEYPEPRPLYWSPLEGDWLNLDLEDDDKFNDNNFNKHKFAPPVYVKDLQDLNGGDWEYHSGGLDYKKNTLSFRFDLFYEYYDTKGLGAHDHYILGIEMEFEEIEVDTYYDADATLNWTHYTESIKARGKNLQVDFQHLKCTCYCPVTITIEKQD